MSPGRRSASLPRSDGTMQNVQVLLQPTEIDTQPRRRSRAWPAASTGTPRAPRGSPPGPRRCAGPARAASAASRCCGCRTRRPPTAPGAGSRRGPSAPGSRRPRSACRVGVLDRRQVAEVAVQLVVGVLPDRAGVEDDHVGVGAVGGALGSPPARAARTAARSRARSSGSRRCGPGRCAARSAAAALDCCVIMEVTRTRVRTGHVDDPNCRGGRPRIAELPACCAFPG